jgi:hypothetical protein
MILYKLKYNSKEEAEQYFVNNGLASIVNGRLNPTLQSTCIVELGLVCIQEDEYSEDGVLINQAAFADGYHYDILMEQEHDFGVNRIFPKNPKHGFFGYNDFEE